MAYHRVQEFRRRCDFIYSLTQERIPIIFDLIISSLRKPCSYQGPPTTKGEKKNQIEFLRNVTKNIQWIMVIYKYNGQLVIVNYKFVDNR